MQDDIDDRIARLLDQLDNPRLTGQEIERIQQKVEYLKSLKG